ncbi:putative N-acetyltransferase Eco1/Protein CHROMOSOME TRANSMISSION FIDELITY 7 [Helianthus anomalus]
MTCLFDGLKRVRLANQITIVDSCRVLVGWRNERVIDTHSSQNGRVILVQNDDPPAHTKKVEEVIKMMEMELGDGWIFHKDCKVPISTIFLI